MKRNIWFVIAGALILSASVFGKWTWYLSFVGLIPFLYFTINSKSYKENIIYSIVHGIIFYGISLYWLWDFEWFAYVAVVIYETIYLIIFASLVKLFIFKNPVKNQVVKFCIQVFGISLLWTVCDFLRTYGTFKFSWYGIYHFQGYNRLLLQYVSIFGPYILDFFILSFNMCLIVLLMKKRGHNIGIYEEFLSTCGIILFILLHIFNLSSLKSPISTDYNVSICQGSVDMKIKDDTYTFETYKKLLNKAPKSDLILMPETCLSYLDKDIKFSKELCEISKEKSTPIIIGANTPSNSKNLYNSAILFDPNWQNTQNKINLVPYGEYVPKIIPFKNDAMRDIDARRGEEITNLKTGNFNIICGICYDSDFPEFWLENHSNLLCVISNDWWFGTSFAPESHLIMSVFRAVENGKYLLRCGSNGISSIISPKGEIIKSTKLNEKTVLNSNFGIEEKDTIYHKIGKYYPYVYLIFLFSIFIWKIVYEKLSKSL